MAWLPLYLLQPDVEFLNDWLNQEEEIAFLVANGEGRWIAKKQHDLVGDIGAQPVGRHFYTTQQFTPQELEELSKTPIPNFAEYNLWHIPSGPLPRLERNKSASIKFTKEDWEQDATIRDPWAGWTEDLQGANARLPYFGAGHPGVIHLEIRLSQQNEIPMSNFGWIGNHYKAIGSSAHGSTEKFWSRLRRMAKKVGTQIPRANMAGGKNEIYAFPAAYAEIQNGRPCALNP